MSFTDKRIKLNEAIDYFKDGQTIAIGGFSLNNSPMALIRLLIKENIKDLTIIGVLPLGMQIDILIGAGLVKKLICSAVGLEGFGPAPNFKRACDDRTIDIELCDIGYTTAGILAAAGNLPFYPYAENVLEFSDLPKHNPNYKKVINPFSEEEEEIVVVPPLKPDLAIIHTQQADISGNCIHQGSRGADDLIAESAKKTIVTADEIVPREWLRQNPMGTTIPKHFVDALINLPMLCHPLASHGVHRFDELHLKKYIKQAQTPQGFREYLEKMVLQPKSHYAYLRASGGKEYLDKLKL